MIIPYNTDAPIYHYPITTVGVIVANVFVFVTTTVRDPDLSLYHSWILEWSEINPIQWITCVFMHADYGHLVGNLVFLWVFGLIVEGKLGWWKFLIAYLGIAMVTGMAEQVTMYLVWGGAGGALGASGVIFGLIGIALIWAPKNDVHCVTFFYYRPYFYDLSVTVFAAIFTIFQIVGMFWSGFGMSSELLHLAGFVTGLPIGIVLLKKDWVECEGWDLFTVYRDNGAVGRNKTRERERAEALQRERQSRRDEESAQLRYINASIQQAVEAGELVAASAVYQRNTSLLANGKKLDNKTLTLLAPALQKQQEWEAAIPLLVEWIRRLPPERTAPVRLNLAQVLVQIAERPRQAIAVLKKLPTALTREQKQKARAIHAAATKALDDGNVELEIFDW